MANWTEIQLPCVTDVSDVQMKPFNGGIDVNRLWNAIDTRASTFRILVKKMGKAIAPNITHTQLGTSFLHYESRGMQCVMHNVVSHRIKPNREHHIEVYLQNSPEGFFMPTIKRNIFVEYAAVINGTLGHNLRMRLPLQKLGKNSERIWKIDATTKRRRVRRQAWQPTRFSPMSFAENPSIRQALEKADTSQQQVANVLLTSTLAILFLPLLLTLIPISCFSYVTTIQMTGYILLTDILTVAPIGIKGIELLVIHNKRFRAVVVRMTSDFNRNGVFPEAASSESWGCECRTEDRVGRIGAAFLVIALLAFVLGTTLELVTFQYVRRRRKLKTFSSDTVRVKPCLTTDDATTILCSAEEVYCNGRPPGIESSFRASTDTKDYCKLPSYSDVSE